MRFPCKYGLSLCVLLSGLTLGSCVKRPDMVLSDKDMAPVVADYELARAYDRVSTGGRDGFSEEEILLSVLEKHGIKRAVYDSTMSWYGRNPDKYYELCELVEKDLFRKKNRYAGKSSDVEADDLWPYGRMMVFSDLAASDGMSFSIQSSELEPGQRLRLKMRFNSRAEGSALMGVEYENGTKSYTALKLSDRKLEMNLQTDTAQMVRRIFGNVMLDPAARLPIWADSISLAAFPLDSLEYYKINSQRRCYPHIRKPKVEKRDDEMQDIVSDSADSRCR